METNATRFYDRFGHRICEGDKVSANGKTGVVTWDECFDDYVLVFPGGRFSSINQFSMMELSLIGYDTKRNSR